LKTIVPTFHSILDRRENVCLVCGKVGSASMITYHKYLHGNKVLTCQTCGQEFRHPDSLKVIFFSTLIFAVKSI